MKCSACGSAAVTTGLGNHVSCLTCGFHGENVHANEPSFHADSFPPADETIEVEAADSDEDGEE